MVKHGSSRNKSKLDVVNCSPVFLESFTVAVTGIEYDYVVVSRFRSE